MISSGRLLAERYRLDSRIAVGGMGEVWQASDTRLDRTVAVKILKAELSCDADFLHRFRTEARTTASLNHPGIAAVHDYGEASSGGPGEGADRDNVAYLVMELVKGEPLAGILAREGRIAPARLLPLLEQAGKALQAAHERGLVHRDVKPGNILVARAADGIESVKLTDFGIAKAADAAPVTRNGMVMGTAHYIAPEQATGADAAPASDVYSLAVCGYECLAGHRPFLSENAVTVAMMHIRDVPPPLPPDVPPTVRALIERTLVKDPAQRYADGGEFAAAVAAVRAGHPPPLPAGITVTPPHGTAIGPPSYPTMHPVAPQHTALMGPGTGAFVQMPPQQRKRAAWPWVVVAVLGVALVVMAAVLLPIMLSGGDNDQEPAGGDTTTTVPQQQAPAEQEPPVTPEQPEQPEQPAPARPPDDGEGPEQGIPPGDGEQETDEDIEEDVPGNGPFSGGANLTDDAGAEQR